MNDTRNKLIKISAKLFAKKGFSATSIRQICQAGGTNVSAIRYHFGDKYGLYMAAVEYLTAQIRSEVMKDMVKQADIKDLSRQEALQYLHKIIDRFMDMGFSGKSILLERIFTYAELENSRQFRQALLGRTNVFRDTWFGLISHITGLKIHSPELVLLGHTIFCQSLQTDFIRFATCHSLQIHKYTPEICAKLKQIVWCNTCAILDTYIKGKETK